MGKIFAVQISLVIYFEMVVISIVFYFLKYIKNPNLKKSMLGFCRYIYLRSSGSKKMILECCLLFLQCFIAHMSRLILTKFDISGGIFSLYKIWDFYHKTKTHNFIFSKLMIMILTKFS